MRLLCLGDCDAEKRGERIGILWCFVVAQASLRVFSLVNLMCIYNEDIEVP